MFGGLDILCVSTTDWNDVWGSRQQIMTELAKTNRVFYVEQQIGPDHLLKYPACRARLGKPDQERISERLVLWRPPLMLPGRYYSPLMDRWSQELLARWIRHKITEHRITRFLLWLYPPNSHLLPELLKPVFSLYHCIDRFAALSTGRKRRVIEEAERETLLHVDLCLAYSRSVYETHARISPRVHYWHNGCDWSRIRAAFESGGKEPEDLRAIPRPRLGHIGSVAAKTDLALIERLSREHPDWQFVFVGGIYREQLDSVLIETLAARPNIHLLGTRPIPEIPFYEKGFDLCLVPWKVNEWTRDLQPIKVFEYLATGLPVISTALPELDFLSSVVTFAETPEAFEAACCEALEGPRRVDERAQLATAESLGWAVRLKEIDRLIAERLAGGKSASSRTRARKEEM